ncbi:MAG: hypothetical protein J6T42_03950, partial [Clostridia bacterium]|nr:hypothetical protein [Clostridia bacterium]
MIYKCRDCGASFNVKDLSAAIDRKDSFISCKHCGALNRFVIDKVGDVVQAFVSLSNADFPRAQAQFGRIIDRDYLGEEVPHDAFLGLALANFHVQTIYSDDERQEDPTLVCHRYNRNYFSDDEMFERAVSIVEEAGDYNEKEKIIKYAEYIDKVKKTYDDIASIDKTGYMSFVAYEDAPKDNFSEKGYDLAIDICNRLKEDITFSLGKLKINKECNIFLPDLQERDYKGNDPIAEAKILYAIDHSESMLVIADNNIDSRLRSIFSRFFERNKYRSSGRIDDRIGFICFTRNNDITLPDGRISENIF